MAVWFVRIILCFITSYTSVIWPSSDATFSKMQLSNFLVLDELVELIVQEGVFDYLMTEECNMRYLVRVFSKIIELSAYVNLKFIEEIFGSIKACGSLRNVCGCTFCKQIRGTC